MFWRSKEPVFTPLPTDEDDSSNHEKQIYESGRRTQRKYTAAAASILIGGLLILVWSSLSTSSPKWSSCGDSLETARQRGCSFDLISFAWQTPECFDGELVSEFASWEGNWTFFYDDKFTQEVSQEQAQQGVLSPLFVPWDYHIVHCTFMWRQMHRAYERGWIDSHLGNYNHTLHCQKMTLMDPASAAKAITVAEIIYPVCIRKSH